MDKLLSGEIQLQQNRKRSVKPKFYHRKIVEYAIANAQPIKELIENEKQARVKKTQQDREYKRGFHKEPRDAVSRFSSVSHPVVAANCFR
jgi:hypothetical protein